MLENASAMVHSGLVWAVGMPNQVRRACDAVEAENEQRLALYHRCDPDEARRWITDEADHFFSPEEALRAGLVDRIVRRSELPPEAVPVAAAAPEGNEADVADAELSRLTVEFLEQVRSRFIRPEAFNAALEKLICDSGVPNSPLVP